MHNCGSIWLLSLKFDETSVQPLYKFKKPEFEKLDIILPILYDEKNNQFLLEPEDGNEEILLNKIKIKETSKKINNGDIISYRGHDFRVDLYDIEEKLAFNSFWHENLYLGNLPVFSAKAFEKLIEVEIQKAKRYKYSFSLVLFRFENLNNKIKDIEKIICENIRFTDMLSRISEYEYLLYLPQVKQENIEKIIEKIRLLLLQILDIKTTFSNGLEFNEDYNSFIEMVIRLYRKDYLII